MIALNFRIGHDDNQGYMYKGYLDNIRIVIGEDMTTVSGDPVYSANGTTYTIPTRSTDSGEETPDVGTITLTATGDGDFTWSEVAGTALPGLWQWVLLHILVLETQELMPITGTLPVILPQHIQMELGRYCN